MKKFAKIFTMIAICFVCAFGFVACGKNPIVSAVVKNGTLITTVVKGETVDTSATEVVLTYKDKTVYEGDFVEGVKEGNGSLIYPDGTKYWGDFTKGEIEGEGEFIWNNGYYYKGGIKNGIFNGKGVLKAPNGSRYNGDFLNGVYHGKGKFLWGDPSYNPKDQNSFQESYVGEYSHGKKEGKGQYQLKNGDIFEGEFFADKPHGRGELETNDSIYKALWKNGQIAEQPQIEKKEDIDPSISSTEHNLNFVVRKEDIDITQCKYINISQLGKI